MDTDRFDSLTRSLTAGGSRRRALAAVTAGALGALGLGHSDDAEAGRGCNRDCGECGFCKKGTCKKKKRGKKKCEQGKCLEILDGTPCSFGACLAGQCAPIL